MALLAAAPTTGALTDCDLSVTVDTPTGGDYVHDTKTITWTVSGDDADSATSDIELLDAGGVVTTLVSGLDGESTDWDTTAHADGDDYRIEVEATALCGSVTETTETFTVDNTDPASYGIDAPGDGSVVGGDVDVQWTGTEVNKDVVELEVSSDGGTSWSTLQSSTSDDGSYTWDTTTVSDGSSYRLRLTPTDLADNVGASVTTSDFEIDNTVPNVSVDDLGDTTGGTTSITWSTTDANPDVVDITYSGDGSGTIASGISDDGSHDWDTTTVDDGDYQVTVEAQDVVGNLGDAVTSTVTVNNVAPDPSMDRPAAGAVVGGSSVDIAWTLPSEDLTDVVAEYSVDGGSTWTQFRSGLTDTTSTTWDASGIADQDDVKVRVTATDVGDLTGTGTSKAFTVDNTAPSLTLDEPDDDTLVDGDGVTVAWTASDAHSLTTKLQIRDEGGSGWEDVETGLADDGSLTWTPDQSDGAYELRIRTEDPVGWTATDVIDVTINDNRPDVELTDPQPGERLDDAPEELAGTASDAELDIARVDLRLEGPDGAYWDADEESWDETPTWNTAEGTENWTLDLPTSAMADGGIYRLDIRAADEEGQEAVRSTYFEVGLATSQEDATGTCPGCGTQSAEAEVDPGQILADLLPERDQARCDDDEEERLDEWPGGVPLIDADGEPIGTCTSPTDAPDAIFGEIGDAWDVAWAAASDPPALVCDRVRCYVPDDVDEVASGAVATGRSRSDEVVAAACEASNRSTEVCEKATGAYQDPRMACEAIHREVHTSSGLGGRLAASTTVGDRSADASVDSRDACGAAVGVLANICAAPSGAARFAGAPDDHEPATSEAEAACRKTIGPLADALTEFFDAECSRDGTWQEAEIRAVPGVKYHQAPARFGAGAVREVEVNWTSWENEQLVCYQPSDRLDEDMRNVEEDFPQADVCGESAFQLETRSRWTGKRTTVDHADIRFTVPRHCVRSAGTPTLFHGRDNDGMPDDWEALDATEAEATSDGVTFTATTTSMSPFVFGYLPSGGNQAPVAAFETTCSGLTCTLDATASRDADGTVDRFAWDLDGETAKTGAKVTHTFDEPGTYQVTLTVRDDDGADSRATQTVGVLVGHDGPDAEFAYRCDDGRCRFDASDSRAGDGAIVGYEWDLGNGRKASGAQVTTVYEADRDYQIVLTVRDEAGATGSRTRVVAITGSAASPGDDGGDETAGDADGQDGVFEGILDWFGAWGLTGGLLLLLAVIAGLTAVWVHRARKRRRGVRPES